MDNPGQGWQDPISCDDVLQSRGSIVTPAPICACEGNEQRIVPTGVAAGDNEIEQRRNLSEMHFPGVAACGSRLVGHDGGTAWDVAVPVYVTRLGDRREHI